MELAETEKPDLILIDALMSCMTGIDVLEKLKSDEKTKNIPVVIVTNWDKPEMAQKAMSLGAVDFIVKSRVPLREMMSMVRNLLKD